MFNFAKTGQAQADFEAAPTSASLAAILSGNAKIGAAFGAAPVFFGVGELGGAYATGGAATQTVTTTFSETLNLTELTSPQDLVVGLYGGAAAGTGVSGVTFNIFANGASVLSQTFTTGAAAAAYFTNKAVDLGSLASGPLSATPLTLTATLSVTTKSAASSFFAGVVLGDPPAKATTAIHFVQAMAGLAGGSSIASAAASASAPAALSTLALPSHAA